MITKKCTKCEKIKSINNFPKNSGFKDGHAYWCKDCQREYGKLWRKINSEKLKDQHFKYRNNPINKLRYKKYRKIYEQENREKIREQQRTWRNRNRNFVRELARNSNRKRLTNHIYRMGNNISRSIRSSLQVGKEGYKWESLLGYALKDLIKHLESKFIKGMTWNNYGRYGWTIDHIIPISWWEFETYNDREFKQCWALCNLQPLWDKENSSKGNRIL